MTNKPRPHADVIKAWADGAEVQYRLDASAPWKDSDAPAFVDNCEYRVKPAREYPQTLMDSDETYRAMYSGPTMNTSAQCRTQLVNVGLRHAIDAGQVVTREEFNRAIGNRDARDMAVVEAVVEHFRPTLRLFKLEIPESWQFRSIIDEVKP